MWQLSDTNATCSSDAFNASLDLQHPERGLRQITLPHQSHAHQSLANASLLEVHPNAVTSGPALELQEAYQRGNDLVASYASQAKDVRPQFRWRVTAGTASGWGGGLMIEMLISIHSDRLDADPGLHIQSRVPAQSCEMFQAPNKPAAEVFYPSETSPSMEADCSGASCAFLLHVINPSLDFGLIVPTVDVVAAGLWGDAAGGLITSRISFFGGRLEKGVLRRTQLRLIAAPAKSAGDLLATQWTDMLMTPPPLSA